jgi:hypothetical protein
MERYVSKQFARWILAASLLLLAAIAVPFALYGNAQPALLRPASALAGEVSQAIGVGGNGKLPVAGKDFSFTAIRYFDNDAWSVVTIQETSAGTAYLVLRQESGAYRAVLGPGTQFDTQYEKSLPNDVTTYLQRLGVFS